MHNYMDLKSKINGMLYGIAIGDALGKGTELMNRKEAKAHYPDGLRMYSQIIRDAHRSQWKNNEWTNDTELLLRLCECVIANEGFDTHEICQMLLDWKDTEPFDISSSLRWVLNTEGWIDDPIEVADNVWHKINHFEASNDALGRAIISGVLADNYEEVTKKLILISHPDNRCVSSACVIAHTAHKLFWEEKMPEYEELLEICNRLDKRTVPYLKSACCGTLSELELDAPDSMWYTRKTMAAALWGLWHGLSAEDILYAIVDQAGDADTNASIAFSLAGIKHGIEAIPPTGISLLNNKERLDKLADKIYEYLISKKSNVAK